MSAQATGSDEERYERERTTEAAVRREMERVAMEAFEAFLREMLTEDGVAAVVELMRDGSSTAPVDPDATLPEST